MRRALLAAALLLLVANSAVVTSRAEERLSDIDVLPGEALDPMRPDAVDKATTTTAPAPVTTVPTTRPVDPPVDPYANEPHVVVGSIEIPKLGLSVPLNQGISLRSIDRGPSHWPGTALPGQIGNSVIAGHRVTKTRPFRHIDTLVPGDEIIFVANAMRSVYHVTDHEIVSPSDTWIVNPTPDARVTLFACHPPGSARYRYVVRGVLVSTTPA